MTIEDYLKETEYAITKLMDAVWDDLDNADKLKEEIKSLQGVVQQEYDRALAMQHYAEDPDDVMLGVGRYWENYFGDDKVLYQQNKDLQTLTHKLAAREFSINCLAADIIQHAKQGLSIVYGSTKNWPKGRIIGSLGISEIINASRNQSLHYEEGQITNKDTKSCFDTLSSEQNIKFAEYDKRNLALDVMELLEWRDYSSLESDLLTVK